MVQHHVEQAIQDIFNSLRACICSAYRGEGSDFKYAVPKEALRKCDSVNTYKGRLILRSCDSAASIPFWFPIVDS